MSSKFGVLNIPESSLKVIKSSLLSTEHDWYIRYNEIVFMCLQRPLSGVIVCV